MAEAKAGYGHSTRGHNLQNMRAAAGELAPRVAGGLRTQNDWQREVDEAVKTFQNENQASTYARKQGKDALATSGRLLKCRYQTTEAALVSKINKCQAQQALLEKAMLLTDVEIQHMTRTAAKLRKLIDRKSANLALNHERLQVRGSRPHRELTNDAVQLQLLSQSRLLQNFIARLERGLGSVVQSLSRLQAIRDALAADATDKADAVQIDKTALAATTEDVGSVTRPPRRAPMIYPHAWKASTDENLSRAHELMQDAKGLRRALSRAVAEGATAAGTLKDTLEGSMQDRIDTTRRNRQNLELQLSQIRDEASRARAHKATLVSTHNAQGDPAKLTQHRYLLRCHRPDREQVLDEADTALQEELNTIRAQGNELKERIQVLDRQLARLDNAEQQVQAHLVDKRRSEQVDLKCALLDGRKDATRPRTCASSAVSSVWSDTHSAGLDKAASRTAGPRGPASVVSNTLTRIEKLEEELAAARAEREKMEENVKLLEDQIHA